MRFVEFIENEGRDLFSYLSGAFPLCCESDEFFYFPQFSADPARAEYWDDFSPERIEEVIRELSRKSESLRKWRGESPSLDERVDIDLLIRACEILEEQLALARFHRTQPTFHLTVAALGIASALESDDPALKENAITGFGPFLERAKASLTEMPELFRGMGVRMTDDMVAWLSERFPDREMGRMLIPFLLSFRDHLLGAPVREEFRPEPDLLRRIISFHLGVGMDPSDVCALIEEELVEAEKIMEREGDTFGGGKGWRGAAEVIPVPAVGSRGPLSLYGNEIVRLRDHCAAEGFFDNTSPAYMPPTVAIVPDYLRGVRAGSSYSFAPDPTSPRGCFFVHPLDGASKGAGDFLREYSMLTAHETYPGHHLLDVSRWLNDRPVRRHIESPLFYEGWACFAETLMKYTGYYAKPVERFLLARRRFRRAARGLVDARVNLREWGVEEAADFLTERGFPPGTAVSAAMRYALWPGYQICYSVGFRMFRDLFLSREGLPTSSFVRGVLAAGEVPIAYLVELLENNR